MIVFCRILLFALCIQFVNFFVTIKPAYSATVETELLENTYIQINLDEQTNTGFSIIRTAEKIMNLVEEKYYTLLNWTSHRRTTGVEIPKYNRTAHFGRWINDPNDKTCFNTRALVLIRDSEGRITLNPNDKCSVEKGLWFDDYTGKKFNSREDIQIDHFVPLKNAYRSGAHKWTFRARCLYANFLGNEYHLKAVNGTENMRKGDRSPDKYMPPNSEYTCDYLKNWLKIKFLWGLRMTEDEADFIYLTAKDNHCRLGNFRVSATEILRLNKFARENIELCKNVSPSSHSEVGLIPEAQPQ